jgi:hypothetical protein
MKPKDAIFNILFNNHRGIENAITVGELASMIGRKKYDGLTNPLTRANIKEIIYEMAVPIGSCSKGYFVIINDDEFANYIHNLKSRIRGIQQRIDFIKLAYGHGPGKRKIKRRKRKIRRRNAKSL